MPALKSIQQIRRQLEKQWQKFKFQQAYLAKNFAQQEPVFPFVINLPKPTDKQWLHSYDEVKIWLDNINELNTVQGFSLKKQQTNYAKVGKQIIPISLTITNIEALARYLGKWQNWQKFLTNVELINQALPQLGSWLLVNAKEINKYQNVWLSLIRVCQHFLKQPRLKCYLRQLDIVGIDTKFIEQHKNILKSLLDELLPPSQIKSKIEKLTEHGFEKRFGLLYEQPQIRFRLLDPILVQEFSGLSDLSMPLDQFQQLNMLIDKVFITENKINGLAFPQVNNAMVIFGLGYGIQSLKQVSWLNTCQLTYWGDIDTHGFAMLSQLRGYFPKVKSLLMDEVTLLACKKFWGQEQAHKSHKAEVLTHLNEQEQILYKNLKQNKYQPCLRLEQERIPFSLLEQVL